MSRTEGQVNGETVLHFDHAPSPDEVIAALVARGMVQDAIVLTAIMALTAEKGGGDVRVTADEVLDKIDDLGLLDAWQREDGEP